jgi:hypothetical protein
LVSQQNCCLEQIPYQRDVSILGIADLTRVEYQVGIGLKLDLRLRSSMNYLRLILEKDLILDFRLFLEIDLMLDFRLFLEMLNKELKLEMRLVLDKDSKVDMDLILGE